MNPPPEHATMCSASDTPEVDKANSVEHDQNTAGAHEKKYLLDWESLGGKLWYEHPYFQKYWSHYRSVMNCNQQTTKTPDRGVKFAGYHWMPFMLPCYLSNPALGQMSKHASAHRRSSQTPSHTSDTKSRQMKHSKASKKRKRKRNSSSRSSSRVSFSEDVVTNEGDSHEYEMHITDDMLAFFEASAKHRKERDAMRREEENNAVKGIESDYIDIEGVTAATKSRASALAPSERPGAKRTTQMKLLYGKHAAMIHGMETAMQLTFDRNCDIKQPKLWPNMPLNIKF